MKGRDLVSASARLIGVLAEGQTLSAQSAVDALAALNRMIGGWSTQRLLIPAVVREVFPLVAGTQTYTMGPGANFDTARPVKIERAGLLVTGSGETIERPISLIAVERWAEIRLKNLQSDVPCELYIEGTFPNETLNFWPKPAVAYSVALYSSKPLLSFATLDTEVSLQPGSDEALVYNLAVRLAPEYGKTLSQEVVGVAAESLANLKASNHRPRYLKLDPVLTRRSGCADIFSGGAS